jgi:acyl-CoA dehydrogenase
MDFSLTPDQQAIKDSVARICSKFGDDYWRACDRDEAFPDEFAKAFADAGWFGAIFPESCGGAGLGLTEAAVIMNEVGKLGLAACSSLHMNMFGAAPIVKFGNEAQIQRFLPPLIAGTERACFGVTEPDAGLNTTRITTFAKREGEGYVINGRKVWTSTAQRANKILLLTRTQPFDAGKKPTDGMTLFYTNLDRSKVVVRKIDKLGRSAVDSNELFIEDLHVPMEDRIGEEGKGFSYLLQGLNSERILVAAGFLGAARYALDRAARYAGERVVFDRPIGKNQAIQHPLAESWIQIAAAELMMFKGAALYDADLPCGLEVNAAKYLAAEAFFATATRAVRTHGGYGYAKEFHVERYFRESILSLIAPVSQELILCHIAEKALGLPKSY